MTSDWDLPFSFHPKRPYPYLTFRYFYKPRKFFNFVQWKLIYVQKERKFQIFVSKKTKKISSMHEPLWWTIIILPSLQPTQIDIRPTTRIHLDESLLTSVRFGRPTILYVLESQAKEGLLNFSNSRTDQLIFTNPTFSFMGPFDLFN